MLNEPHLEKQALLWFDSVGYTRINHQERDDCHQVVLLSRLQASLQQINPSLPNVALELAIETLAHFQIKCTTS
jgi:hypothetical protein